VDKPLVNRVANSGLITINLEDHFPKAELVAFDLKEYLFKELILKEKDFRAALKAHDWESYKGKIVTVFCSSDAIIPIWAYMLVSSYAQPIAEEVFHGNSESYLQSAYKQIVAEMDGTQYQDKRIVIKGCSNKPVPTSAYVDLTSKLRPFAQSVMYGEPCSTVPIFKKPRKLNK